MKRILFSLLLTFSVFTLVEAQVGINTENPDPSAVLDITDTSKGVLLPRLTTAEKIAIQNPAYSLLVYDTDLSCYSQYDGTKWRCIDQADEVKWFYMPSISIKTDELSTQDETLDLYAEYTSQFMGTDATTFVKSAGAPSQIPYFPTATNLYYYVTYYSKDVFKIISISASGIMKYRIIGNATDETHVNVVFVLK